MKSDATQYLLGEFGPGRLDSMKTKQIKIKSYLFPAEVRCEHVQGKSKECNKGCYFLEKPSKECYTKCNRSDCEGHVFEGETKEHGEGLTCFGKKGGWLVAIVH